MMRLLSRAFVPLLFVGFNRQLKRAVTIFQILGTNFPDITVEIAYITLGTGRNGHR